MGIKGLLNWMPDKLYIETCFRARTHKKLKLEKPETFNEKIQWLKLNDRNPLYTQLVDKYEVREYITNTIGDDYLMPLLGVYDNFDEINFTKLPSQFVLKCTHDSGGLVICQDKTNFDKKAAKVKINKSLNRNYYYKYREWPYKNVKPRIICEDYISEGNGSSVLTDYKFYCFNGKVKYCQVIRNRGEENETIDFYDTEWNLMPFTGLRPYPNSTLTYPMPPRYKQMVVLANKLSQSFPFVRIDFYNVNSKIIFGEFTFYPQSGLGSFYPTEWNNKIGDLLKLIER